jgi:hypothetical protein
MIQIDCPWCARPAALDVAAADGHEAVDCAECGVRVDLVPDALAAELARAA